MSENLKAEDPVNVLRVARDRIVEQLSQVIVGQKILASLVSTIRMPICHRKH